MIQFFKDIKARSDLNKSHSLFLIITAVHKHSQEAGNPQLRLSMFTIYHFDPWVITFGKATGHLTHNRSASRLMNKCVVRGA